jgi:hypothetical protein
VKILEKNKLEQTNEHKILRTWTGPYIDEIISDLESGNTKKYEFTDKDIKRLRDLI